MNIQIRVMSAQAQSEMKAMRAQLREMELEMARANRTASTFGAGGLAAIGKWGSQLQWAGRQLQYAFTLPIAIAAGAATNFALDNEKAMTRLKKVYGDGVRGAQFYRKEIDALGRAFEGLSNMYGVARSDVINIAADWAAAGSSGLALAKATKLTIETMILGELDAATATKSLIAIQAQYGQSTDDLAKTIDILNMVENQTGASMSDLIDGFTRAAGVARNAGIDVRHLSAMIAALTPAAGSASQAGNAIKTIISRLMSPTQDAIGVLGELGIKVADTGWKSVDAGKRLEILTKKFNDLPKSQKAVVSATLASRYQINKFDQLMADMANKNGYYAKSLEATIDPLANQAQRVRELNMVLDSSPQKFKQIWTVMQNLLADAIQPMLPGMIRLAQGVTNVLQQIAKLDPNMQQLIVTGLVFLALLGPLMRYVGVLGVAFRYVGGAAVIFGKGLFFGVTWLGRLAAMPFKAIWWGVSLLSSAFLGLPGAIGRATIAGAGFAMAFGSGFMSAMTKVFAFMTAVMTRGFWVTIAGALRGLVPLLGRFLLGPWGLAIAGLVALFSYFRDDIVKIFNHVKEVWQRNNANIVAAFQPVADFFSKVVKWISDLFWKLPESMRNALIAVVNMVKQAAEWVANAFTAMFSPLSNTPQPSQIQQRTTARTAKTVAAATGGMLHGAGTGTSDSMLIRASNGEFVVNAKATKKHQALLESINADRYRWGGLVGFATGGRVSTQRNTGTATGGMTADLAAYQRIADMLNGIQWNKEMNTVAKGFASALPLFSRLLSDYKSLNALAMAQAAAVARQEQVVAAWKTRLDQANAALDLQQRKLDAEQQQLDKLTAAYDAHKQALENYASAPIQGMQAMSDAIFENQMAQKKLQLQMLEWEKQHGSIEKVKNDLAKLQGEIEKLQGTITDLRGAGAGSDITGPLDAQLKAMKDQYAAMGNATNNSPYQQMQDQLDALQQKGQELDLMQSIKFDPLTRQIDQLANGMKELPFDQIVAGIKTEQAAMDALQPKIDAQNAAIERQKAVIDAATQARDAVQARYDAEQQALDALKNSYDATEEAIRRVEEAMRGLSTAAQDNIQAINDAKQKKESLTPGVQNFRDAAGGDFPDPGKLNQKIGREGGLGDQSAQIDQWIKDNIKGINFDGIDIFKPIKDAWAKVWDWIVKNVGPVVGPIWDALKKFVSDLFTGDLFGSVGDNFKGVWENIKGWWDGFLGVLSKLWEGFAADVQQVFAVVGEFFQRIWTEVGPALSDLGKTFMDAWPTIWQVIQDVAKVLGGALLVAIRIISAIFANVLGPTLNAIVDVFLAIIKVAKGVIEFFVGFFTLNLDKMGQGIIDIFGGLWDGVFGILNGAVRVVWGIIQGFVEGVVGFFVWLQQATVGPNSVFSKMVNGIIEWWNGLGDTLSSGAQNMWNDIIGWFQNAWNWIVGHFQAFMQNIVNWWNWLVDVLVGHSIIPDLVNAIVGWFQNAWKWVVDKVVGLVTGVISWFASLPGKVLSALSTLGGFLSDVASKAFTWFKNAMTTGWNNIWTWITTLPGNVWNALIVMKDRLFNVASTAFTWFKNAMTQGWQTIWNWLVTLPQAVWNGVIAIKDKLINVGSTAFSNFKRTMSDGWNVALAWLATLPMSAWYKVIGIKDKLIDIGSKAMTGFWDKVKELWNGAKGILAWFGGLPAAIGTKLQGIGGVIGDIVRKAWNGAAGWLNVHAIKGIRDVASKFGLTIPYLPGFAKGGVVPGGRSKHDNMLIKARSGEGVLVPEAVQRLGGKEGLDALNRAAEQGRSISDWLSKIGIADKENPSGILKEALPKRGDFGLGGSFGLGNPVDWLEQGAGATVAAILDPVSNWINSNVSPEVLSKFLSSKTSDMAAAARKWGASGVAGGIFTGGAPGTVWPVGNAPITAGFPNYPSGAYHGGVDFGVPTGTMVRAFRAGRVIASGWDSSGYGNAVRIAHVNGYQSIYGHNQRLVRQVGDVVSPGTLIAFSDSTGNSTGPHLHFGIKQNRGAWMDPMPFLRGAKFDAGGWLNPGVQQAINATGRPEPVFTAEQWTILKALVVTASTMLKSMVDGAATTPFGLPGARGVAIEQRLRALEAKTSTSQVGSNTTININGDLVLPNIRSGDDASKFIEHLKILAG